NLAKTGGTTGNTIQCRVDNGGTVNVPVSPWSITLNNGGTHTGTFQFVAGTTLAFNQTHVFNQGAVFTGAGTVSVVGGNFTVNTLSPGQLTLGNINQSGGSFIDGTGLLDITGTYNWNGGSQSGTGNTAIKGTATANITAGNVV